MYDKNNKPSQFMDVKEVQDILGVGKDLAYSVCDGKRFPVKRLGRRIIVHRRSFYEWMTNGSMFSVLHQ